MAEIPLVSFHENLGLPVVANEQFDPAKKPFLVETHLPTPGCQGLESNIWKQDATKLDQPKVFSIFSRAFGAYSADGTQMGCAMLLWHVEFQIPRIPMMFGVLTL